MGRARGANARLHGKFESTYGTPPAAIISSCRSCRPTSAPNRADRKRPAGPGPRRLRPDAGRRQQRRQSGRAGRRPQLRPLAEPAISATPTTATASGFGQRRHRLFGAAGGQFDHHHQRHRFTFVASGATGNQINIGATLSDTLDNAVTVLNASVVSGVAQATYSKTGSDTLHDRL
jgi:hypothetical protein